MGLPKTSLLAFLTILLVAPFASGATLTLSGDSGTPGSPVVLPGTAQIPMLQLSLASSGGYPIRVTRLTLTAQGTLDDAAGLTSTDLYVDTNANGSLDIGTDVLLGSSSFFSDDGTAVFSAFTRTINSGFSENWLVVYTLSPSAAPGASFRAGVASNFHVTAQFRSG
jgi:hypothetical protein